MGVLLSSKPAQSSYPAPGKQNVYIFSDCSSEVSLGKCSGLLGDKGSGKHALGGEDDA